MSKFIRTLQPGATALVIALAIVTVGAVTTSTAYAQEAETGTDRRQNTSTIEDSRERLRTQREALETKRQEASAAKEAAEAKLKARHEAKQDKLSASQLEICKNREENINNRIARIADRSVKHIELFDMIAVRAQSFYDSNEYTLANYDELIADVAAKKVAAETAVATISNATASFDCEGENPKVTIEEYKAGVRIAIDALKEYRSSVKNLIVGIKSVNPEQNTDSGTSDGTN